MDLHGVKGFDGWENWKDTISKAVGIGGAIGLSDDSVQKVGFRIGSLLSVAVDPENKEQRVLQELWKAGNQEEKMALTRMIIKASQYGTH